ncbi:putative Zinc finger, BED-type, HAT dimerization domain, ribonuclease H-like superfamily [Plasmopara halstedii]
MDRKLIHSLGNFGQRMDTELILEPPDVDDQSKASECVDVASASTDRRRGRGRGKAEAAMVLPSFIWDYFVKDASGKYVICTLCPAQTTRFAYSGGTSTMNRHLRKKHQKYAPATTAFSSSVASSGGTSLLDTTVIQENLYAGDSIGKQRHQLLELRTARRRAVNAGIVNKKRKHDPIEQTAIGTTALTGTGTEFDPSGFVTMPGSNTATSSTLQFSAGFELSDAAIEMGVGLDQRLFDYTTLPTTASNGVRGRRHGSSTNGTTNLAINSTGTTLNTANQKILTHRLLKYLIAQYEPLNVTQMGTELSMLLFGGSTEWPTSSLNFGYGGSSGFGMNGFSPKLPSEETIKLALANLYYSQREILKEVMADVEVLSLSLNNWTSVFGQNVLTVSGHWISRGFRRRDCVLEVYVLPLDERVNTIALLRDVLDKWEIPASKVAALTMRPLASTTNTLQNDDCDSRGTVTQAQDEAKVEASAIHSEYPGIAVVSCFVEEIEAAMSSGMKQCAELTRRCRNYVSFFIQNPSEYQIFLALQRSMGEEDSASTASSQKSMAATADGVSVSLNENDHTTLGDELDNVKEGVDEDSTMNATSNSTTHATHGNNGESLPVICDFDNRWNSTAQMMCRVVELESMLQRYKMELDSDINPARRPMQLRFSCCELSSEEWTSLKQLARLLEPIEGLVHVSPQTYPGLSIIYPLLHSLKKHLTDAAAWVSDPLVATVRHTIIHSLQMNLCLSGEAPSSPYLSCLLDPRFKSLAFLPSSEKDGLVKAVYSLLGVSDKSDIELVQPAATTDDIFDPDKQHQGAKNATRSSGSLAKKAVTLLHDFFPFEEPASELERVKIQVQQYLDSPPVPATNESEHDPLEWWSRYQRLFPSLARLAKKYLSISAVSTPFQEAFTSYGQLMREKKARLDIEVAAQVLFCRSVSRIPEMERIGV